MPYTAYTSVAKMGLAASGGVVKEQYIPLWIWSSSNAAVSSSTTSGTAFLAKGTTAASSGTAIKLHTLNSNWSAGQKFALEASINADSGATGYAALWDFTANAIVGTSQISRSAGGFTVVRSSLFTLTSGHQYGVSLWTSSASLNCYLTKAHLVAIN